MTVPALSSGRAQVSAGVNRAPPAHPSDGESTRTALTENGLTTYTTVLHADEAYEVARLAGTRVEAAGHAGSTKA